MSLEMLLFINVYSAYAYRVVCSRLMGVINVKTRTMDPEKQDTRVWGIPSAADASTVTLGYCPTK